MRSIMALAGLALGAGMAAEPRSDYQFVARPREKPIQTGPTSKRKKVKAARAANVRRMQRAKASKRRGS